MTTAAARRAYAGPPLLSFGFRPFFLLVFAAVVWREVLAGRNWRNLPVCALISLLALANVGVHLRPIQPDLAAGAERLALGVAAMMIALIGGRVTPSFTRNWLAARKARSLPAPESRLDLAALMITLRPPTRPCFLACRRRRGAWPSAASSSSTARCWWDPEPTRRRRSVSRHRHPAHHDDSPSPWPNGSSTRSPARAPAIASRTGSAETRAT